MGFNLQGDAPAISASNLNKLRCNGGCNQLIEVRASKKAIAQIRTGFDLPFKVSESCEDLVTDEHSDFIKSGICGVCWSKGV